MKLKRIQNNFNNIKVSMKFQYWLSEMIGLIRRKFQWKYYCPLLMREREVLLLNNDEKYSNFSFAPPYQPMICLSTMIGLITIILKTNLSDHVNIALPFPQQPTILLKHKVRKYFSIIKIKIDLAKPQTKLDALFLLCMRCLIINILRMSKVHQSITHTHTHNHLQQQ